MGKTKRKYVYECILFRKKLRKPLENVADVMPRGFSYDDFKKEFKLLYSYLWDEICIRYQEYKKMDEGRVRKNLNRIYHFPSPDKYFKMVSEIYILKIRMKHESPDFVLDIDNQRVLRDKLRSRSLLKEKRKAAKNRDNQKYMQTAVPKYTNLYIQRYFDIKHRNPADVDSRYAILYEASLYRNPVTIEFLHKVNCSERNFHLRHFAFTSLQKMGESVRLRKNRKGKVRIGDTEEPNKIKTPDELVEYIMNSDLESCKSYDMFVSHSSSNANELLKIKSILNNENLNIYVDWMCDRDGLKRELVNEKTAEVICKRLDTSESLMYVHTPESLNSRWTPWEIGYFHAKKGKICIYSPCEDVEKPPYIELYPKAIFRDDKFQVLVDGKEVDLIDWIDM